jgi:ABC-type multidrug transport system fused ATPase/permease subunit
MSKKLHEEKMFGKYAQMSEEDIRKGGGRGHGPGRGGGGPMGGRLFGEKPKDSKKTLGRVIKYLGSSKTYLVILIFIVFITSLASIITPVLSGAAIDAIPLRTSIILNNNDDNSLNHIEVREVTSDNKGLILGISKENKWVLNQVDSSILAYNSEDKTFNSFVIIENGKVYVYSENNKIDQNTQPKSIVDDDYLTKGNSNVYKITLGNSGIWEVYKLNANSTDYFINSSWTKVEGIRGYGVGSDSPNVMFIILIALGICYVVTAIFNFISSRVSMRLSQATIRKLRKDLF